MIIVDSDVLIDALNGRSPATERIALELRSGSLATTAVSAFEVLCGARAARRVRDAETLLDALTIVPLDVAAARAAAAIRRELEASGTPIGMADYLIAGVCRTRSAILLTRNRAHFERVDGVRLGSLTGSD
jgi:predicted nucleic acid-binding protein